VKPGENCASLLVAGRVELTLAMAETGSNQDYVIWGADRAAYGPVDGSVLKSWVQEGRVTGDMWIFRGSDDAWQKASAMPELKEFFAQESKQALREATNEKARPKAAQASQLRGIKILAGLSDAELGRFAQFGEVEEVRTGTVVVRQGERDENLYLIAAGEMRVRILAAGAETALATLMAGECFGDLALLDHGPRSADVVAHCDSVVVKMTRAAFDEFSKREVEASTAVLRALDRTLAERIRADTAQYVNTVKDARSKQ